jgi:Mycobacterium membrane protein
MTAVVVLLLAGAGVAAANVVGQPPSVVILSAPGPREAPVRSLVADQSTSAHPVPTSTVHVRYELTGARRAGYVTFTATQPGTIAPLTPVRLPWRTEFDAAHGFIPTITAQNSGDGAISCRIAVNGRVVSEVTSEGPFGVVTCTGSVITDPQ